MNMKRTIAVLSVALGVSVAITPIVNAGPLDAPTTPAMACIWRDHNHWEENGGYGDDRYHTARGEPTTCHNDKERERERKHSQSSTQETENGHSQRSNNDGDGKSRACRKSMFC